jgi:hypothetical protein
LTTENMLQAPGTSKSTRLRLAEFGVSHAYNHYGQSGRTGLVVNVLSCAVLMNGS